VEQGGTQVRLLTWAVANVSVEPLSVDDAKSVVAAACAAVAAGQPL
jgi:hypothetical protein